jgi:hypothetical protein
VSAHIRPGTYVITAGRGVGVSFHSLDNQVPPDAAGELLRSGSDFARPEFPVAQVGCVARSASRRARVRQLTGWLEMLIGSMGMTGLMDSTA